jgi:predicted transport protein
MPLFAIKDQSLSTVEQTNFVTEKALQSLIEANLETMFSCRFIASEFSTGANHAGRIDTLALSEDNNPVIIEYKKVESSELVNQSLFYLHWIHDHRGDFEIAVKKKLGVDAEVDWSDVRVICIAPNYKKYDLLAVQVMATKLELWTYRLFKNDSLYLEEVLQKSFSTSSEGSAVSKDPKMVAAGKKAAETRASAIYSLDSLTDGKPEKIKEHFEVVREFILELDPAMEEVPKKHYVAYKISQNIVCVEIQKQRLLLFVKLNPKEVTAPPEISRDVSDIGHYGTGNLELSIRSVDDFESIKPLIELAYQKVGG